VTGRRDITAASLTCTCPACPGADGTTARLSAILLRVLTAAHAQDFDELDAALTEAEHFLDAERSRREQQTAALDQALAAGTLPAEPRTIGWSGPSLYPEPIHTAHQTAWTRDGR